MDKNYQNLMAEYIGHLNNDKMVYYDTKIGYVIREEKSCLRNPTHKELRQIKAKYGNLEKKCRD
jgi:hypothetical protein